MSSLSKTFEVCFTVYNDETRTTSSSSLNNIRTLVNAAYAGQARSMIEAQYGSGRVSIYSVTEKR